MKIQKSPPRTGKTDLLCLHSGGSPLFSFFHGFLRVSPTVSELAKRYRLATSCDVSVCPTWRKQFNSFVINCQFQIFSFEKTARFCSLWIREHDSHGFLWMRFHSVWPSFCAVFSHCSERCSASDRVDCKVKLVSFLSCLQLCVFVWRFLRKICFKAIVLSVIRHLILQYRCMFLLALQWAYFNPNVNPVRQAKRGEKKRTAILKTKMFINLYLYLC